MNVNKKRNFKISHIVIIISVCLIVLNTNVIDIVKSNESLNDRENKYKITTIIYNKDKTGSTIGISGITIFFNYTDYENGTILIDFYDIQFADSVSNPQNLEWHHKQGLDKLKIYIPENFDSHYISDQLKDFPHDSLDAYSVYTNLLDILAFKTHKDIFIDELYKTNNTSYISSKMHLNNLPDWPPLFTDMQVIVEKTFYTYIAGMNNVESDQIFFYKNDNTLINQTMNIPGVPFPMTLNGNTRYFGHITVNSDEIITHATMTEYFISQVKIFNIIPIYSFIHREQILELIEN